MEKKNLENCECEKCVTEQLRTKSTTWWVGMIDAIVVAVTGVLIAKGYIDEGVGGAIVAGSALIYGYCNGNNPSIKGQY